MIELSAKQVRELAVPLIRETMGDCIGDRAEAEWAEAVGDDTGVYGYFLANKLVGVGGVGYAFSGKKVWLGYLAVRPEFRRCGIATALLRNAEMAAHVLGYEWMYIETYAHPAFEAAVEFYEATGYQRVGELAEFLDDGSDAIYYRKRLTGEETKHGTKELSSQ